MKKNILVFPCGSEIALEVYRAVNKSTHFNLIGASSCDDHGMFVFDNYIDKVPFISDEDFISSMEKIVKDNNIDAIYPAMDAVIEKLKSNEDKLSCKVIASKTETTKLCLSKSETYRKLDNIIRVPKLYKAIDDIKSYPVFTKPDIGYGSRGAKKCLNADDLKNQLELYPTSIICEYLPGEEYTVDCFTNNKGKLLCALPRIRSRIMNGISVNTKPVIDTGEFITLANRINNEIDFNGAWFFQVKRDENNELVLMEIASRFGGSSSLFRAKGVNFALMSLYNAFDIPVSIIENDYNVEMDRALDNKYKIDIKYDEVFVDFDDCIYLEKKFVNEQLITFLYRCRNRNIKLSLLSKHDDVALKPLDTLLKELRIEHLFDRIIHIDVNEQKSDYIDNKDAIFIDDSFAERKSIKEKCGINVFSVDMVEVL